jgi:hypothetical protein
MSASLITILWLHRTRCHFHPTPAFTKFPSLPNLFVVAGNGQAHKKFSADMQSGIRDFQPTNREFYEGD